MADTNQSAREYFVARQRKWRASGKCNDCGNLARPGKARCQACQDKSNIAGDRWRARQKAKKQQAAGS